LLKLYYLNQGGDRGWGMKALILAIVFWVASSTFVCAETIVKFWRVGSILVAEYVDEDSGDRVIYAYSKPDQDRRNTEEEESSGGYSWGSESKSQEDKDFDDFSREVRGYRETINENRTVENVSKALDVYMGSSGWGDSEYAAALEYYGNTALSFWGDEISGLHDEFVQWIDFLKSQPHSEGIYRPLYGFAEHLIAQGDASELKSGIAYIKSMIPEMDNKPKDKARKSEVIASLIRVQEYTKAIGAIQ